MPYPRLALVMKVRFLPPLMQIVIHDNQNKSFTYSHVVSEKVNNVAGTIEIFYQKGGCENKFATHKLDYIWSITRKYNE